MAGLEELMAGLFGGTQAPAGDEMRRRRSGPGGEGGYGGIGGAAVTPGQMMPYYGGIGQYDFSGAMGNQMGGRQGLMSLLGDRDLAGPALRHFANQGFDFGRPGQDNREKPGGPNIAPGNIDNAQALFQPQGPDHVPGVPQGVAVGQAPGEMRPRPQTQGWRNIHPGYSAAAQFGTDQGGNPMGFGGRPQGAPAAAGSPPGASTGGGGGGGGAGPQSQNPVGGGGGPVAPGGPTGGGGGGTGGGQSSGGKQTDGGGPAPTTQGRPAPGSRPTPGLDTPTPRPGGGPQGAAADRTSTRPNKPLPPKPTGVGPQSAAADRTSARPAGKLSGLSAAEKASRKASWEAKVEAKQERRATRQEAQRQSVAQKSAQYAAPDPRGMGTDPLPKAGKTRPKPPPASARKGQQR